MVLLRGRIVMESKTTIVELAEAKRNKEKIAAVSCYDYTTARFVSETDVKMILVGDSAAQIILGYDSTLPATMDFMVAITAGVRRGAPGVFLVADMPFLSYQVSIPEAVRNAGRFVVEAGVQMVKIEVTGAQLDVVKAVSDAGIAVMAHIGIRPQRIGKMGRFKAEATTAGMAAELVGLADQMVAGGASMLLVEGTAAEVAQIITERSEVPVISCGSGSGCDGQILVATDILGAMIGRGPKFAKSYATVGKQMVDAFQAYCDEVKRSNYPDAEHSYHMKPGELEKFEKLLAGEG